MSCCPPAPVLTDGASSDPDVAEMQDGDIAPGESVECYMKRVDNPSGMKDDLNAPIPDKIENTSVPVGPDANITVTFRLTNGSTAAGKWFIEGALPTRTDGNPIGFNQASGKLGGTDDVGSGVINGTVRPTDHNKPFTITVIASRNSPTTAPAVGSPDFIDSRKFSFMPGIASANDIQFVHPLPGQPVSSPFGPRMHPVRMVRAPHKGVDFNTPGAALNNVLAAADGEVVYVGEQGAAGKMIKIDHKNSKGFNMCQTVYMHLSEFYVAVGQKVAAGQKIAKEGNTGAGTGPHLHFECRIIKGGQTSWVDPLPFIREPIKYAAGVGPGSAPGQEVTDITRPNAVLSTGGLAAQTGGCAGPGNG